MNYFPKFSPAEKELFKIFTRVKNEKLMSFPKIPKISDYSMYEIPMPAPRVDIPFAQSLAM